jgi:hypothetical protein
MSLAAFGMKLPMAGTTPTETAMATLTGQRTERRRNHLRLVKDERAPRTLPVNDPTPGPRDAATLVAHFDVLLPEDLDADGLFSFGAE